MNFKTSLSILLIMGLGESHAYKHHYSSPTSSFIYRNWTSSTPTHSIATNLNSKPDLYGSRKTTASLEQSNVQVLKTHASGAISTAGLREISKIPSAVMQTHTNIHSNMALTASSAGSAFSSQNTSSHSDLLSGTKIHSNLTKSTSSRKHHGQNEICKSYMPGSVIRNRSLLTEEGLSEQCLLWDDSCSGCVARAEDMFFNYTLNYARKCFVKKAYAEAAGWCDAWHGGDQMSKLRTWMRGPECLSSSSLWDKHPVSHTEPRYVKPDTCCGRCAAHGRNTVEIYYWPSPDADYSCLSVINNTQHPIDMGATTTTRTSSSSDETITFWDCTLSTPDKKGKTVISTAVMTTWDHVTLKVPRANPWDPPSCVGVSKPQTNQDSIQTLVRSEHFHSVQNVSKVPPPSITQNHAELPVTAVLEGYTFTSPSVYARFRQVSLGDYCGDLLTIPDTMLGFAPGRLSTIALPLKRFDEYIHASYLPVSPFDPADLPCPPTSVMKKAWYKPEPWVPYRPIFALPDEIRTLEKDLERCSNIKFAALDPPIALTREDALVSSMPVEGSLVKSEASITTYEAAPTSGSSRSPGVPPSPGAVLEQGAVKTSTPKQALTPTSKDSSPQDSSPNDSSPNDSSPKDPSPKDPSHRNSSPKDSSHRDSSHRDSSDKDSPNKEFSQRDPSNKDSSTSYLPGPDNKKGSHNSNTVQSNNVDSSGPLASPYNVDSAPESAPKTGKGGSASGATLVKGKVQDVESNQNPSHVHDNSVASSKPDSDDSNATTDAPTIDATSGKGAAQNDSPGQDSKPLDENSPASNKKDLDVVKNVHGNKNVIDNDDSHRISSVLSKYSVSLTSGGAPAIVTTGSGLGHKRPLTLSLDSDGNLFFNPQVETTSPISWGGEGSNNVIQPPSRPVTTTILNNQPLVILPNGQGVSVAGTTLYPASLLGDLPTAIAEGKYPSVILSGTSISLLGTSVLVLGGSVTVTLPTPSPTEPVSSTVTGSATYESGGIPTDDQASPGPDGFSSGSSNNDSGDPQRGQVTQGPENFTGSALSINSFLLNYQHMPVVALILTTLILSINF